MFCVSILKDGHTYRWPWANPLLTHNDLAQDCGNSSSNAQSSIWLSLCRQALPKCTLNATLLRPQTYMDRNTNSRPASGWHCILDSEVITTQLAKVIVNCGKHNRFSSPRYILVYVTYLIHIYGGVPSYDRQFAIKCRICSSSLHYFHACIKIVTTRYCITYLHVQIQREANPMVVFSSNLTL